jgi:hypothetical protein
MASRVCGSYRKAQERKEHELGRQDIMPGLLGKPCRRHWHIMGVFKTKVECAGMRRRRYAIGGLLNRVGVS